jgi:CBS-domain-containing membrane protein
MEGFQELEAIAMRAHDIMSRPVYSVRTTDTVESAAALLTEKKVTAAPVIDEAGELVGMVSEGDLLWHRVPEDPTAHMWRGVSDGPDERPRVVADVMSGSPVTTWPDADVADVAQMMLRHDIRSVPVVDHGDLVGIVSRRDILRTVVRGDDVLEREIQHRLDEYAGGERRWTATVTDGMATVDGRFDDEVEREVVSVLARTVPGVRRARFADRSAR